MAAFAISSSATRWMHESAIMFRLALFGRGLVLEQTFAGLDVGELDRLLADLDCGPYQPCDREARRREIARLRKIGAEMRAARILALPRGERNDAAHLAQRAQ